LHNYWIGKLNEAKAFADVLGGHAQAMLASEMEIARTSKGALLRRSQQQQADFDPADVPKL
jgi:hypothetical protein